MKKKSTYSQMILNIATLKISENSKDKFRVYFGKIAIIHLNFFFKSKLLNLNSSFNIFPSHFQHFFSSPFSVLHCNIEVLSDKKWGSNVRKNYKVNNKKLTKCTYLIILHSLVLFEIHRRIKWFSINRTIFKISGKTKIHKIRKLHTLYFYKYAHLSFVFVFFIIFLLVLFCLFFSSFHTTREIWCFSYFKMTWYNAMMFP